MRSYSKNFFIARNDDQIVGSIGHSDPGKSIRMALEKLPGDFSSLQEIVSVYVHPDHQERGLGTMMFEEMKDHLHKAGIKYLAVSSGYEGGILFWQKKLGSATIVLPDYYYGYPAYIWIKETSDRPPPKIKPSQAL